MDNKRIDEEMITKRLKPIDPDLIKEIEEAIKIGNEISHEFWLLHMDNCNGEEI